MVVIAGNEAVICQAAQPSYFSLTVRVFLFGGASNLPFSPKLTKPANAGLGLSIPRPVSAMDL